MEKAERIIWIKERLRQLTFGSDEDFDVEEVDLLVKELLEYDNSLSDNTSARK